LEHPESRPEAEFKHPQLLTWVKGHRSELVYAALTVVQNWIAQGQPSGQQTPLGMYEKWARVMSRILAAAGIGGFLSNLEEAHAAQDEERRSWREFFEAWWIEYAGERVGVKDLHKLVEDKDLLLHTLNADNEHGRKVQLGLELKQRVGRRFGDYKLADAGSDSSRGTLVYRLEPA